MLKLKDSAPQFELENYDSKKSSLKDFIGKKIVLYFYPKDDTPGCTAEACSFRDVYDDIIKKGAVVIGISPDNIKSHKKFKTKFNLPFYLLADTDHKVSEIYGVWGEKKMYGKTYFGIIRSTFIIDEQGLIKKIFPKVTPAGHSKEVLESI